jgi:hypothetical protein
MKPKLKEKDLQTYQSVQETIREFNAELTDRVSYILQEIFKSNLNWWAWSYTEEDGGMGGPPKFTKDEFKFYCEMNKYKEVYIIDKDGVELDLESSFPTRWLYEDFEEELATGFDSYNKKQEQKKAEAKLKAQARSEKQKELVNAALLKLSKEERKALGL